ERVPDAADPDAPPGGRTRDPRMWREPLAWAVAVFLGCQSISYYAVTAWLPTLLIEDVGVAPDLAGGAMSAFQLLGIGGTLLIPLLSGRRPNQSWLGLGIVCGWVVLGVGLLLWPSAWPAWVAVGGVVQGAGISFAFTVLVLRAHDAAAARSLSSMVQLVGYSLGAAGPVAFGALFGATGGWTAPLLLLLAVSVAMAVSGWAAGRNRTVGAPSAVPSR
ncbi:MFS transporter, partial [Saccharomonospora iraqiensis]